MSVIIKGMDMPIDCLACRIGCKHESYMVTGRPEDCPLEEAKTGDQISRADAIDAICKVWCYTTYGMCPHDDGYCKGCDEIEAIDALPSAEGGDAETNPIPTGTGVLIQSPNNGEDLISRADAICEVLVNDGTDNIVDRINALPSADAVEAIHDTEWVSLRRNEYEELLASAEAEGSLKAIKRQIDEHWYLDPPSAEAVQGEWKRVETRTYKGECTNCGFRHIFMDGHDSQYRFCPNCGARMKGGEDE